MNRTVQSVVINAALCLFLASVGSAQQFGGIRGTVYDREFDAPLPEVQVTISETGQTTTTDDEGLFLFGEVLPGTYTVVFSKAYYTRQFNANVVVAAGRITESSATLPPEFWDRGEFVIQDLALGGSDIGLLNMRFESPKFLDAVSPDMMSKAGVSNAADSLRLVSGATVQDGKYAVVRGLPDRYVNGQLNGVRLPTADADKRAVQLDQFPTPVIESMQVSKTFTPDEQGDASGGAVNVVTKGIPDEATLQFSAQIGYNSQTSGGNFLTYDGGGVNFWGRDDGGRDIQLDRLGSNWLGAVGVAEGSAPLDYKWSLSGGGKIDLDENIRIGGFGTFFYEHDSSFFSNGIDDKYWVDNPGEPLTPQYTGTGSPQQGNFYSQLFDVAQGSEGVKWGGLATVGLETDNHAVSLLYMYTRAAQDKATLAEDTRGKAYYFPGYDPYDPNGAGNAEPDSAPYLRLQTLEYTERTTQTIQFSGDHTLVDQEWDVRDWLTLEAPQLDWAASFNSAGMNQPDKRQFGVQWWGPQYFPGYPPYTEPSVSDPLYLPFKPAEVATLGHLQRTWRDVSEEGRQQAVNIKFPFVQWSDDEGYIKLGLFHDKVDRTYNQESFGNFNDTGAQYAAPWDQYWSDVFPSEDHAISAGPPFIDVDYEGHQKIFAWYYMADLPLSSVFKVIGGVRHESTDLTIINYPEEDAKWVPLSTGVSTDLNPGDADVSFSQSDTLPSLGFEYTPVDVIKLRGSYSQTIARQTFKELTPIQQVEYLGGDVFVGNPGLQMSALDNYDLRLDYIPYTGGLLSVSYFYKSVLQPIEYVQKVASNNIYTTPVNYPEGTLSGWEMEIRQEMGHFWESLDGLSVGANATFIDSEVILPEDEAAKLEELGAPIPTREMTGTPEFLYNLFFTYDMEKSGTTWSLFYTVRGDTLAAGAGQSEGHFVPSVYEKEYGTLNFSLSQSIGERMRLKFQAKNLLDPMIQEVYRSPYTEGDTVKTSYTKGIDLTLSMAYDF